MGATGAAIALAVRLAAPSAFVMLPVWLTAVVVAGVPFSIAWLFTTAIALATDRYEAYVLPPAVQALLVLCLATSGGALFGLDGAVVGMTIASVIVGVGSAVWATRRTPRTIALGVPTPLRSALTFGLKGYAGNALQLVNYRLDLFVLAAGRFQRRRRTVCDRSRGDLDALAAAAFPRSRSLPESRTARCQRSRRRARPC